MESVDGKKAAVVLSLFVLAASCGGGGPGDAGHDGHIADSDADRGDGSDVDGGVDSGSDGDADASEDSDLDSGDVAADAELDASTDAVVDADASDADRNNDADASTDADRDGDADTSTDADASTDADVSGDADAEIDSDADVCIPDFGDVAKVTDQRIGEGGHRGQALDMDGDPGTCSPSSNCVDGLDNALSPLGSLLNDSLNAAVHAGDLTMLWELLPGGGNTTDAFMYYGELAATNLGCDFQAVRCDYAADATDFNPAACAGAHLLPGTMDGAGHVVVGGPLAVLEGFVLGVFDGAVLAVDLYAARLEMDLSLTGGNVVAMNGVLGGAIRKDELADAISMLPPDSLPFPPESLGAILDFLVEDDVDTDGDGAPDAASIGFVLAGIDGAITELTGS